jgi:hypothetical protein
MSQLDVAVAQTTGTIPWWAFVLGAIALAVVSTLGPLSRWHERRTELGKQAAAEEGVDASSTDDQAPESSASDER